MPIRMEVNRKSAAAIVLLSYLQRKRLASTIAGFSLPIRPAVLVLNGPKMSLPARQLRLALAAMGYNIEKHNGQTENGG